jgi:hypothetical protein
MHYSFYLSYRVLFNALFSFYIKFMEVTINIVSRALSFVKISKKRLACSTYLIKCQSNALQNRN